MALPEASQGLTRLHAHTAACSVSEAKTPRWLDEQRVELLCISSYEEKLYRTMDSTVLY